MYRNIRHFRTKFKNSIKAFATNEYINEHFIGVQNDDITGFFHLFHGTKNEIADFLRGSFDMAEDSQAIFEFIQNAADCGSTQFCLFFDEEHFLAINNGEIFSEEGIQSILNIGQSYGKSTGDKIGRFGVGFKLVHRLVGVSDGLQEIVQQGAGPILFSWSKEEDLKQFLDAHSSLELSEAKGAPWLFKILLTCFPVQVGEIVKDLNYTDHTPFSIQELSECRIYANKVLDVIELTEYCQGSLFYLKLGTGKAGLLQKEAHELERGASVSLRFLKSLQNIQLNEVVLKSSLKWLGPVEIAIEDEEFKRIGMLDKKSQNYPLQIEVGYKTIHDLTESIASTPNFYKYFPMSDEVNRLRFVVHTNAFLIGTNRRHLHNDPINHRILETVSNVIQSKLDEAKENAPNVFRDFFAAILLSEKPSETRNEWQYPHLYKPLLDYIRENIPTNLGQYLSAEQVVIKNSRVAMDLRDWGIEKEWFYWSKLDAPEDAKPVIKTASDKGKLGLNAWDLADLLRHGDMELMTQWFRRQHWEDTKTKEMFFKEISKISTDDWARDNSNILNRFWDLPFLRVPDEEPLVSIRSALAKSNVIIAQGKISAIGEVEKLELKVLCIPTDGGDIEQIIQNNIPYLKDPIQLFEKINQRITDLVTEGQLLLNPGEKQRLFSCLQEIVPNEVAKLRSITLFCDSKGCHRPMYELLPHSYDAKPFLEEYYLHPDEAGLEVEWGKWLAKEVEVYNKIILPNWDVLLECVGPSNYEEWLRLVKGTYDSSNNKVSLKDKKCVLTQLNGGESQWDLPSAHFFHTRIKDLEPEQFRFCNNTFSETFGYSMPKPNWVKYLSEHPFGVKDMRLNDLSFSTISVSIKPHDLIPFIYFCTDIGDDFFDFFLTNYAENNLVQLCPRGKEQFQYADQGGGIARIIDDYLPGKGFRLPEDLREWATKSSHILRAGDLQKEIMERLQFRLYEIAPQLARLLTTKDNVEFFFKQTIEFVLPERSEYHEEDEELSWLGLASKWLDNKGLTSLRKKIAIRPIHGEIYNLEKVPAHDYIKIEGYQFQKSKLLPNDSAHQKAFISQKILRALEKTHIDTYKLKILFASADDNWYDDELIEWSNEICNIQNNQLENDHQAAFFAVMLKTGRLRETDVQILAGNGNFYPLQSHWILKPYDFVSKACLPDVKYKGLDKRLHIRSDAPIFAFGGGEIIEDFYFANSESFHCFGLVEEPTEAQSLSAIVYLFDLWVREGAALNFNKRFSPDIWPKTIGFDPAFCVYPTQFATAVETLPEWLRDWVGGDGQKQQFLTSLGVNTVQSPVVQLRSFLDRNDKKYSRDDLIRGFDPAIRSQLFLLENTLRWITNREFKSADHLDIIVETSKLVAQTAPDSEAPRLVVRRFDEGDKHYKMKDCHEDGQAAIEYNQHDINQLDTLGISEFNFFEFFSKQGYRVIDQRILPDGWHNTFEKLTLTDPKPDFNLLREGARFWEKAGDLQIFWFDGNIPEVIFANGIEDMPIATVHKKDYVLIDSQLYLNESKGRNSILTKAISELRLDLAKFNHLITDYGITQRQLDTDVYEDILPNWTNVDKYVQKEINDEAKRMAAEWLRKKGYSVPDNDPPLSDYYKLLGIKNPQGQALKVHVRSTKGGYLYLSPQDWSELAEQYTVLIVILPGNRVTSVSFDELIQRNDRIELQFNAQSFSPTELGLLAHLFAYRTDVKFVIKSPNFIASDYLNTFGLYERSQEPIKAVPTHLID